MPCNFFGFFGFWKSRFKLLHCVLEYGTDPPHIFHTSHTLTPLTLLTVVTVGRSTSSITPSTNSKVKYRRTVNTDKRRSESASLYVAGVRPNSASSFRLFALLQRERKTGSYTTPLIGCIAPSALKCFADKQGMCMTHIVRKHTPCDRAS